jgi:hypothetical protein
MTTFSSPRVQQLAGEFEGAVEEFESLVAGLRAERARDARVKHACDPPSRPDTAHVQAAGAPADTDQGYRRRQHIWRP